MKDVVIPGRLIIRELSLYAGCLLAALLVNIYSIVHFRTHWKELFTTFHISLAVASVFFAALAILRLAVFGCRRIFRRRKAA
jgi:hypothetical protein